MIPNFSGEHIELEVAALQTTKQIQDLTHKAICDKMKSLRNNVIGRKNLQLVKENKKEESLNSISSASTSSEDEDSSSSSSSSSSSDNSSVSNWSNGGENETVIQQTDLESPPPRRYSLRQRSMANTSLEAEKKNDIQSIINNIEVKETLKPELLVESFQDKVKQY